MCKSLRGHQSRRNKSDIIAFSLKGTVHPKRVNSPWFRSIPVWSLSYFFRYFEKKNRRGINMRVNFSLFGCAVSLRLNAMMSMLVVTFYSISTAALSMTCTLITQTVSAWRFDHLCNLFVLFNIFPLSGSKVVHCIFLITEVRLIYYTRVGWGNISCVTSCNDKAQHAFF